MLFTMKFNGDIRSVPVGDCALAVQRITSLTRDNCRRLVRESMGVFVAGRPGGSEARLAMEGVPYAGAFVSGIILDESSEEILGNHGFEVELLDKTFYTIKLLLDTALAEHNFDDAALLLEELKDYVT